MHTKGMEGEQSTVGAQGGIKKELKNERSVAEWGEGHKITLLC